MNKRILSLAAIGALMATLLGATLPVHAAKQKPPTDFSVYSKAPGRMVNLVPVNDTKTHGIAVFIYDPLAKQSVVTVAAIGLPTGGKFFTHIETGPCGTPKSVVATLPTMYATDKKAGATAGVINGTWQAKSWHISIYRKAGMLGMQRWSVACATV